MLDSDRIPRKPSRVYLPCKNCRSKQIHIPHLFFFYKQNKSDFLLVILGYIFDKVKHELVK